jgi:hypothetical protein
LGPTRALPLVLLILGTISAAASAEEPTCQDRDRRGHPFATCFDPGNRLALGAGADLDGAAFEAGIQLRHLIVTEEPSVTWRFEHELLSAAAGQGRFEGTVYAGRYLRHSRDGHLVLPTQPPTKVFLPFDVGVEVAVGRTHGLVQGDDLSAELVRTVAFLDLARSGDFRRRLALGTVVAWDVTVDREPVAVRAHAVVPFSAAQLAAYAEDRRGLTRAGLTVEGGARWSTLDGWGPRLAAEAGLERVLVAVNDRPLSLFLAGGWDRETGLLGRVGVRVAVLQRARTGPPLRR